MKGISFEVKETYPCHIDQREISFEGRGFCCSRLLLRRSDKAKLSKGNNLKPNRTVFGSRIESGINLSLSYRPEGDIFWKDEVGSEKLEVGR
jgi:hypothetical protein